MASPSLNFIAETYPGHQVTRRAEGGPQRSPPSCLDHRKDRLDLVRREGPAPAIEQAVDWLDSTEWSDGPLSGQPPPGSRYNSHSCFGPPPFSGAKEATNPRHERVGGFLTSCRPYRPCHPWGR